MASDLDTTSFNSPNGFLTTVFNTPPLPTPQPNSDDRGVALAIRSDNRIILAGYSQYTNEHEISLACYNTNGSLYTAFGTSGRTLQSPPAGTASLFVNDMILQTNDYIVVTGTLGNPIFEAMFIARFDALGALDTSFGTNGFVITTGPDFNAGGLQFDRAYSHSIVLQPDGKFVIGGSVRKIAPIRNYLALVRYTSTGGLDPSFGTGGLVYKNFDSANDEIGNSLAIQTDGKLILAGQTTLTLSSFLITRFNSTGSVDTTFNASGTYPGLLTVASFFSGSNDYINGVKIDSNGRIIVGGFSSKPSGDSCMAVACITPSGVLDTSFGINGQVVLDLTPTYNLIGPNFGGVGNSITLQNDDKIVIVGGYNDSVASPTVEGFALARFKVDGSLDTTFGLAGLGYILSNLVSSETEIGYSVEIQSDGKILVGGTAYNVPDETPPVFYFVVARYFGFPPNPPPIPVAPICFPAGTPVSTDQGSIPIEKIEPGKNTIRGKEIVAITKTISPFNKLVCFEKGSLGHNIPNKRTYVSLEHCIVHRRRLIPALRFVNKHGIYYVNYMNNYLYNVLMENHTYMMVNNMMVETLNPKNIVAKLVSTNLSNDEKIKLVCRINDSVRLKMKMINHQKNQQVLTNLDKKYTIRNKQVFNVHARHPHPAYNITVNANSLVKRRYKHFQYTRHAKQTPGAGFSIKNKIHVKSI
jgi:uncharacterized delta-60 repeat protein